MSAGRPTAVQAAAWRYVAQRASAAVLAVCVVVHLVTIVYATRHGLSGAALLARAHASAWWPAFYTLFVVAVAIHAPLGLRVILDEWSGWRGRTVDMLLALFGLTLLTGGMRAVVAVTA